MKNTYKIEGMDCEACAKMIELDLEDVGITAKCSFAEKTLKVENNDPTIEEKIRQVLENQGYKIIPKK